MKSKHIGLGLMFSLLVSGLLHATTPEPSSQLASPPSPLQKACLSNDGKTFAKKDGSACVKGDLVYINVAFDTDQAGDLAEQYCDFSKENPPEAMDVYGVLCYLKTTPKAPAHR